MTATLSYNSILTEKAHSHSLPIKMIQIMLKKKKKACPTNILYNINGHSKTPDVTYTYDT